ncbi:solute carrier family 43 member 3-like isoform X1 [Xiphophorus maculatus]|uniref:solute carrier family 43 member 3-like isoform X1 n=1 Tax=Xiphophorus maculatus TaxID=8083 RepID=UPI000C6E7351|nr:solute carrier family 43 member 3-like isoform X1 [Xiphophorus maculatus]
MQVLEKKLSVRRCLTFVTGLVECLCFAGVVFGWASLVFVLKEDGYFSSLCFNTTGVNDTQKLDCSAQDEQFSLIFTITSFINNFFALPNGFLFDHFGTTVARLLAIFLYTTGSLMVALSSPALSFLLFLALPLLAIGGILFLITNMQTDHQSPQEELMLSERWHCVSSPNRIPKFNSSKCSSVSFEFKFYHVQKLQYDIDLFCLLKIGNLFDSRRSTIINLYNGAFDSSSALFLIIKLLHESGVSLRTSFLFLSACSVVHILRTFFLLPRTFIPHPLPDRYAYGVSCGPLETMSSEVTANSCALTGAEDTPFTKDVPLKQEKTFRECLLSRFFVGHLLWLSVMQLRHFLFIGTLNPMLLRLTDGDSSLVSQYTNAFAFTQLCAVLCAPWNGLIMDRHRGKPRAAGAEPLLPLRRQRSLHQRGVSILPLWEAVRSGHGSVCSVFSAAVSLLCSGERTSGWRSFIRERRPDAAQRVCLHTSRLRLHALSKSCL